MKTETRVYSVTIKASGDADSDFFLSPRMLKESLEFGTAAEQYDRFSVNVSQLSKSIVDAKPRVVRRKTRAGSGGGLGGVRK